MRALKPAAVALAALASGGSAAEPSADWIVGHWLSCDGGREVSESWAGGGGLWAGVGITRRLGAETRFEWMRIGPGAGGRLSFFASPQGTAVTEFPLKESGPTSFVFENPTHDFLQRVLYSRSGDVLTGAIEGAVNGETQRIVWTYRRASPTDHCPGFGCAAPL